MTSVPTMTNVQAMTGLRRRRQKNRLADLEWFEAAYRVYLIALLGGGGVLWLSSAIGDQPVSATAAVDVYNNGPTVMGIVAALAFLIGLRSGAQGGPLALEEADVAFVMLSPVDRFRAMLKPAWQRARSAVSGGVLFGAITAQLAGRRLPGSPTAWAAGGALFGATVAALWIGAALVAHAIRLPRWLATVVGLGGLTWQIAAVAWHVPGPASLDGGLALWGWRQRPIELLALFVAFGLLIAGFAMLRRTSLEALARRSGLVAQLRFAVTMQDLRTVILLRRQLNQESTRRRPWVASTFRWVPSPIARRGLQGLARFPLSRLVRMTAIAIGVGLSQAAVVRGTTPALALSALLLFLLGLEVLEPLAQEIDHPDRTEALPVNRAPLLAMHLIVPALTLIPLAVIAGAAAVISLGQSALGPASIMAIPTVLAGATGAVVSIVRDAPDPLGAKSQQAFVPPEMAGFGQAIRTLLPLVASGLGAASVFFVRSAQQPIGAAVRSVVGSALLCGAVVSWVRYRDQIGKSFSSFLTDGRDFTSQQRSSR